MNLLVLDYPDVKNNVAKIVRRDWSCDYPDVNRILKRLEGEIGFVATLMLKDIAKVERID